MGLITYQIETIPAIGTVINFDIETLTDVLSLIPAANPQTMTGNVVVNFSGTPTDGQIIKVGITEGCVMNGNTYTVNGFTIPDAIALKGQSYIQFSYVNGGWGSLLVADATNQDSINGDILVDETVTLAKLEDLTSAQIIVGSGANRPTAVAVTGDIAITNAGVTSIGAGVIVNADINASAAIARSKMASGTASHVVINDGSGVFSSEAQLATSRGGTGQDTSASTGFATVSAGTWNVGSINDVITLDVSFETGELGDFKIKLPYDCTVTEIYAYAYKAIAGTDNGTIVPKDNGGTTMTGGTITFAASDPRGTAYTSTPTANNSFSAGDLLTLTTAKTTAGGKVLVSVKVTRNL